MAEIIMYSTQYCSYCDRARQLLYQKNANFHEIRIDEDPSKKPEMIAKSGRHTVPQLFINGKAIGGCDDLYDLERNGQLDQLLNKEDK